MTLDFGTHEGRHINKVHDEYLQLMLKKFPESSPWWKRAADVLKERGKLKQQRVSCNVHALLIDLKSCSTKRDLQWGRRSHAIAEESGNDSNIYVATALIKMYAKCGSMVDAQRVFDSIQEPDVVCWTALLLGYAENGEGLVTLEMFCKMKLHKCLPDSVTYVAALKACTSLATNRDVNGLKQGREIHSEIGHHHLDHHVQNTLIEMYASYGSMAEARGVFDNVQKPDVVSWNAMLLGYVGNGEADAFMDFVMKMKASGCVPNSVTYVAALKACASSAVIGDLKCLKRGREIHLEIGGHLNLYVQNTLIYMYGKCGSMVEAQRIFDCIQLPDVVSWNALIMGYAENGQVLVSLDLFSRMKVLGCAPNSVTYVTVLKACAADGTGDCLELGREIHSEIDCHLACYVQGTLIDMYAQCRSMVEARGIFDSIEKPDVVCWTALLMGYAENGEGLVALELFWRMKAHGCAPDSVTYVAAVKSCTLIGALELGRKLHSEISEFDGHVVTSLVDLYAKCGSMIEARAVFDLQLRSRNVNVATWNALLAGYGRFGDKVSVFNLFEAMEDECFRPNAVTFVSMLSCCSHAGLVVKARGYFEAMSVQYGITPGLMHYNCMVDVLGRANQVDECIVMLCKMSYNPNAVIWRTVLAACCKCKNVGIGKLAFQNLVVMDKKDASAYVLMAQIYGRKGMWEEQDRLLNKVLI